MSTEDSNLAEHALDNLPALLQGELTRPELIRVVAHLRACDECRRDLVEVGAAHAALKSLGHAPATGETSGTGELTPGDSGSQGGGVELARPQRPRSVRRGWLAAAAAVVIAAAGTLIGLSLGSHGAGTRRVELVAVGTTAPQASGAVTMTATASAQRMQVQPADLPKPPAGYFYEVWLFDPATGKMLPVGILASSGASSYVLADDLVNGYTAVDVSLQEDNGDPAHSKDSVLRANYG